MRQSAAARNHHRREPGNRLEPRGRIGGQHGAICDGRPPCQLGRGMSGEQRNYLSVQFKRLAIRRGNKPALVAEAHTILCVAFPRHRP
jgi:hypothetical protein